MKIHVSRDGQQFGPYDPDQVRVYLAEGSLVATDLGWAEGNADWVPITQLVDEEMSVPPSDSRIGCPK